MLGQVFKGLCHFMDFCYESDLCIYIINNSKDLCFFVCDSCHVHVYYFYFSLPITCACEAVFCFGGCGVVGVNVCFAASSFGLGPFLDGAVGSFVQIVVVRIIFGPGRFRLPGPFPCPFPFGQSFSPGGVSSLALRAVAVA